MSYFEDQIYLSFVDDESRCRESFPSYIHDILCTEKSNRECTNISTVFSISAVFGFEIEIVDICQIPRRSLWCCGAELDNSVWTAAWGTVHTCTKHLISWCWKATLITASHCLYFGILGIVLCCGWRRSGQQLTYWRPDFRFSLRLLLLHHIVVTKRQLCITPSWKLLPSAKSSPSHVPQTRGQRSNNSFSAFAKPVETFLFTTSASGQRAREFFREVTSIA